MLSRANPDLVHLVPCHVRYRLRGMVPDLCHKLSSICSRFWGLAVAGHAGCCLVRWLLESLLTLAALGRWARAVTERFLTASAQMTHGLSWESAARRFKLLRHFVTSVAAWSDGRLRSLRRTILVRWLLVYNASAQFGAYIRRSKLPSHLFWFPRLKSDDRFHWY